MTYADIEFLEIIEANLWLDRSSLIRSLLVSLLGVSELLELSYAFATAYTPELGYDKVTEIIDESAGDTDLAKKLLEK